MLQIESLTQTLSFSAIVTDRKIHSSLGTEATSDDACKKKISLCSCSSSISLEENLEYTKEKEVFARYLFAGNTKKSQKIFIEMNQIVASQSFQQDYNKTCLIDLSQSETDIKGKILTYFIGIWLRHMGYGTKKNRSSLMGRVKIYKGYESLNSFNRLYENLNLIPLSKMEKKVLMLETCRNGWEYFIQQLCKRHLIPISTQNNAQKQKNARKTYQ